MSELELLHLDSPKSHSSGGKKSSATSSWGESVFHENVQVHTHVFSGDENASPLSPSSNVSQFRAKNRKKSMQETSFSSRKGTNAYSKDDLDDILSLHSDSEEFSSSESESVSTSHRKPRKFFRNNKVNDVKTNEESRKSKINDSENSRATEIELKSNRSAVTSPVRDLSDSKGKKKVTSTSELSYRERIRGRFHIMKEKAVESLSRPQSRSQTRTKILTTRQVSRMDDLLKLEEDQVSAAMERHEKIKLRWQHISKSSLEKKIKDQDESDNFFMEIQKANSPDGTIGAEKSETVSEAEAQEDSKVLTSEFLGIKEEWDLVEFVSPEHTDTKKNKVWEEYLFYPSTKSVSLEEKLEPGLTPRCKEEEGIYIGKKIHIPSKIKNKMESRILKTTEGKKWFGVDGDLILPTSPLKPFSIRPLYEEGDHFAQNQVILKPATLRDMDHQYMDLSGNLNFVFDIDINTIEFSHHPLFSREHVLANRLKDLYVKYKKKKEADNLNRLNERLNALRKTKENLKIMKNQTGDNKHFTEKLQKCEEDIREVRRLRYLEGKTDKNLTNKIIMTWKDLLKLREDQGCQNTPLKLSIKKKNCENLEQEKIKWDADIKIETKEIVEELKKEYEKSLELYNEKYEIWFQSTKKMGKPKRKTDFEDISERLSDTESPYESDSDKEELPEEPKPPEPVVVADIKSQVIKNFKEGFRQPGEPEIEFILTQSTNLDTSLYNNKEQLRRAAVKRSMVFVKLFYNGKEVCRSKSQHLSQNFTVSINQRFAIRILEWPESLMLEIHEESRTLNRNLLVPGIYLPFPDSFMTVYNSEAERHEFSSKTSINYHHTAVGAGNKVIPCPGGSDFNNQPICLYTSGIISCRVGWVVDNGKILSPPEKYWSTKVAEQSTSLFEILRSGGPLELSKLKEWAENSKLDPNAPYNSAFFHFLENAEDIEETKPTHFRLNPLLSEFDFCKESEIENNTRWQCLKLRDAGESDFKDLTMVPLNEKQIYKEMFKDYEKKNSTPHAFIDAISTDPLDGHRIWGKKYLQQVHQKLLKQSRMSKVNKRYQDIITEENIPDVGTVGLTFMKWLRPKRPLRPVRKEQKKIKPQNLSCQEISIVVNIVRAFEVPVRKDLDAMSGSESIEGFALVNVRPFVEISFRGLTARTTTAEGANPTWNQNLEIPVRNKTGYFSPGNLPSIKDTLYLHLFDEVVIDLIEDENARETNIHQRLEKHWLASMEIPFSTLYFNSKIEGTFKLYSPPVLLGYEREAHRRHIGLSTKQETTVSQRDATYITLFVTVQPALNPPKPVKEKMESRETTNLKKHLEGWQQEVSNLFPHRKIKTLVLDITGKSVCVTRFVKPLTLPPIAAEENITPEMVARFVAMIPTAPENNVFPEYFDIWLTCDQVLHLMTGNSEDHAVLLCSYFLQLGLQAFVLLGSGIPRGAMAYVLVKKKTDKSFEHYVWDPTNGQKYNVGDSFCPLQKVYCLINDQNIWANIQSEELPTRTKFDLTKKGEWFPVFGKNISAPKESVQPNSLDYRTTPRQAVDILRDKIEKKLRDNLMKWRRKSRTQWNRYCAATLRKLLPSLEESTWNSGENHNPDHVLELQHILGSHKMCGFPINLPYTNIEAISEAVKATGVHCNESEGVEFALAVYIHSYPNDVLSVWVYVASLIRRR